MGLFFFCIAVIISGVAMAGVYVPPTEVVRSADEVNGDTADNSGDLIFVKAKKGNWRDNKNCTNLYPTVLDTIGSNLSECFMKLFFAESGCRHKLPQAKGNAGNPHAGFGLCTIEVSPALRKKRGLHCQKASVNDIKEQILCCRDIMLNSPRYFGPVRRKEVPRCG